MPFMQLELTQKILMITLAGLVSMIVYFDSIAFDRWLVVEGLLLITPLLPRIFYPAESEKTFHRTIRQITVVLALLVSGFLIGYRQSDTMTLVVMWLCYIALRMPTLYVLQLLRLDASSLYYQQHDQTSALAIAHTKRMNLVDNRENIPHCHS